MDKIAVIVYGIGGELGDFKIFSDSLEKELEKKYTKVINKYVDRDHDFIALLNSIGAKEEIEELHIFSHSIGAGIFLGYKDPALQQARLNTFNRAKNLGRKVTYMEAVETEKGTIQTDDFKLTSWVNQQKALRKKFSPSAFIKIWGCNSGVGNWVYSDGRARIVDPNDTSVAYYWRAFNEKNVPKLSIAQAFANYFNRKVYGALSGASIEVKHNKKWISSKKYKQIIGHWPSGRLPHRLIPDKGVYNEFKPPKP